MYWGGWGGGVILKLSLKNCALAKCEAEKSFSYRSCGTWHPQHLNWASIVSGYAPPPILDCNFPTCQYVIG